MSKEIKLPKLSEDADEGSVAEVMIKEGDTIEKDESIIAVESDKATVEVPSPEAGTVKEVKVSEGDSIKTGDIIAVLEDEDGDEEKDKEEKKKAEEEEKETNSEKDSEEETADDEKDGGKGKKKKQEVEKEGQSDEEEKDEEAGEDENDDKKEESAEEEEESEEPDENEDGTEKLKEKEASGSEEIPAAPGAKRLAREHDVTLDEIEGSGPDGLITKGDVKKAVGISTKKNAVKSPGLPDFSKWGTVERQSLSQIRKTTARQTQSSWQTIPHVTQFDEADVSGIEEYIEEHQAEAIEQGAKLTVTAVLTKVIANALHQFPKFNASVDMDAGEVILKKYVHIGVAVDTDEGLLVPVVRNVDEKSIIDLAIEITEFAEKARDGELSSEDMEGGNFIISNLGGIGGTQFTPVIFHPQVAILGVSEMKAKPVYNEEDKSFQPVLTLPLSLSYDHRLIDGAEGARFLRYVCNALEDPYKALLGE